MGNDNLRSSGSSSSYDSCKSDALRELASTIACSPRAIFERKGNTLC
jgi:hypothetical protein